MKAIPKVGQKVRHIASSVLYIVSAIDGKGKVNGEWVPMIAYRNSNGEPFYRDLPMFLENFTEDDGKPMEVTEANTDIVEGWHAKARDVVTMRDVVAFYDELANDYEHDYGTICHAMAALGIAAMRALNNSEQGGITGFQAGCVMWEFIKHFMHMEGPMRLIEYKDILYPQFDDKFDKKLSKEMLEWLQEKAKKAMDGNVMMSIAVAQRHHDIIAGKLPEGWSLEEKS